MEKEKRIQGSAQWLLASDGGYFHCSACGYEPTGAPTPFCPMCGVNMTGQEKSRIGGNRHGE